MKLFKIYQGKLSKNFLVTISSHKYFLVKTVVAKDWNILHITYKLVKTKINAVD